MLELADRATALRVPIFWITGRGDVAARRDGRAACTNDVGGRLPRSRHRDHLREDRPEVDAGYAGAARGIDDRPRPTRLAELHRRPRSRSPGSASTRPMLNKAALCGPSITAGASCPTHSVQSPERARTSTSKRLWHRRRLRRRSSATSSAASRDRTFRCRTRTTTARRRAGQLHRNRAAPRRDMRGGRRGRRAGTSRWRAQAGLD